jgi:hypothetical protein
MALSINIKKLCSVPHYLPFATIITFPGKMPDIFWLAKVFGPVISFGSGQLAKDLKSGFLLVGKPLPAHLPASLQPTNLA